MTRGRDWRGESLAHLRWSWPSWLTTYDIARKLNGPSATGSGRGAQRVREACEQMVSEGLLESRPITQEGAPYGRPYLQFRALFEEIDDDVA